MFSYRTAQSNLTAQEATSLQTLRTVLFTVHQRYFDALRARELLRVATLQVERTQKILDQTRARVRVGDAPEKDILQAEADYLNAEAASLAAQTQVASSEANLKATIGWAPDQDLPPLVPAEVPDMQPLGMTLDQAQEMGLRQRPDLAALRQGIIAQRYGLRLAEVNAGITFSLDANYRRGMAPDVNEDRNLTFLATIPLYDGSRSRESVSIQKYQLESRQANLVQAERNARAEIEAAYKELELNGRRLTAAAAALNAAKRNYEAAIAAQERGAQGTNIITVLTANVSLVTAESGYVQALHDLLTSQVRLRLVLGEPIVGDELK
jgi:outer membrane protein